MPKFSCRAGLVFALCATPVALLLALFSAGSGAWPLGVGARALSDTHAGDTLDRQNRHQPVRGAGPGTVSCLWSIRRPRQQNPMAGAWPCAYRCGRNCL